MRMENPLNDLEWQGNSKQMYQAVLNEVPRFFKGMVQRSIIDWVLKNKVESVTEDIIFMAVDDIASGGLAEKIKTGLEKYKTKNN